MTIRTLRLCSGLVVALFVTVHLANHALGLVSVDAMEAMRRVIAPVWRSTPGAMLLYGALGLHVVLALYALYARSTLRMPAWEALQLVLGLLVVPLLAAHAVGARGSWQWNGQEVDYAYVLQAIWSNDWSTTRQVLLVAVVWLHLTIGIHFWLRLRDGYTRWVPLLYPVACLWPLLALLGFWRAAVEVSVSGNGGGPAAVAPAAVDLSAIQEGVLWGSLFLVLAVLLARELRRAVNARGGTVGITLPSGRRLRVPVGQTVLECLRQAQVAHPSVCGGRARCTTCRVRVCNPADGLTPPGDAENRALTRIGAPPGVRLACQLRPNVDVLIQPLLPPTGALELARRAGGFSGEERTVTVLVVDLRGSTALAERRMPYDVLFVLNEFFAEMTQALTDTGGFYAQFNGDGLLALYGLDGDPEQGARQALVGAAAMAQRLVGLNRFLAQDLDRPLRIGIGVHTGEAIVGTMGPPSAPTRTAIGDNVNIAARLEAMSKTFDCVLVVSEEAAHAAGVDFSGQDVHEVEVSGRVTRMRVYAVSDPTGLVRARAGTGTGVIAT